MGLSPCFSFLGSDQEVTQPQTYVLIPLSGFLGQAPSHGPPRPHWPFPLRWVSFGNRLSKDPLGVSGCFSPFRPEAGDSKPRCLPEHALCWTAGVLVAHAKARFQQSGWLEPFLPVQNRLRLHICSPYALPVSGVGKRRPKGMSDNLGSLARGAAPAGTMVPEAGHSILTCSHGPQPRYCPRAEDPMPARPAAVV